MEEITLEGTRVSYVYYQWKCPYEKSLETYRMHVVYEYKLNLFYASNLVRDNNQHKRAFGIKYVFQAHKILHVNIWA